jgi:hypothetical protein
VKPGVISAASKITIALITNKNKPNVSTVKGKVSSTNKGLMVKLIRMMTATSNRAEGQLLSSTPLRRKSARNTEIAPTITLNRKEEVEDEFFMVEKVR